MGFCISTGSVAMELCMCMQMVVSIATELRLQMVVIATGQHMRTPTVSTATTVVSELMNTQMDVPRIHP
jgi:hypothetical protein